MIGVSPEALADVTAERGHVPENEKERRFRAPDPKFLKAAVAGVLVCLAGFLVRDAITQFASIDWTFAGTGDAAVDWAAAKLFWRNESPYTPEGLAFVGVRAFGHPPTTPFWFLPMTELDLPTFGKTLGIFNLGLALALVAVAVFTLALPLPYAVTALVFGAIQGLPPALEHAVVIQISLWIALAYVLAWRWLRNGQDIKAGCVLGLACTLKLFPGVMVLFALFAGRLRTVVAAAAAYLAVAALMTWRWGFGAWLSFFQQQDTIARRWLLDLRNASLHGVVRRAFGERCAPAPYDHNLGKALAAGASLVLLAAALWWVHRARSRQPQQSWFDRSFSLFAILSAFINPWIWEHYFYLLVLPALIGFHAILRDCGALWQRWASHRLGSGRLLMALSAAALGAAPVGVAWAAYRQFYKSGNLALQAYCAHPSADEVRTWLLGQVRYLDLINWLPWVLFLSWFVVLLAYRPPLPLKD